LKTLLISSSVAICEKIVREDRKKLKKIELKKLERTIKLFEKLLIMRNII